ncbi:hypothetical protein LSH36_316g07089 [Paralvinella palmiformis]|uniref:Uncharacterized protein n=1 Tax=Paralvinella palmiformis TaxID=53620 RepID=A0AAD9JH40_9ANNE|nr:hypothetical protein LSH36_316g07089 [Paralvinella palmiformis]
MKSDDRPTSLSCINHVADIFQFFFTDRSQGILSAGDVQRFLSRQPSDRLYQRPIWPNEDRTVRAAGIRVVGLHDRRSGSAGQIVLRTTALQLPRVQSPQTPSVSPGSDALPRGFLLLSERDTIHDDIRFVPGTPDGCVTSSQTADITAPSGYLSNYVTLQTGSGSRSCPWRIRAAVGQKINITLINFARATSRQRFGSRTKPHVCYQFAVIREDGRRQTLTECEGGKRLVHVYLTSTNAVQISMLTRDETDFYFMLHYEGRLIGCADPVVPPSMWVKRTGDTAVIRCNATGDSWGLTCTDRYWHGHIGNCTITGAGSVDWQVGMFNKGNFPYSILIIVAIGVALGVFLGGILLVCVSKYLRSRAARRRHNALYQSGDYGATPGQATSSPEDVAIRPSVTTTYHTERIKAHEIKDCKELKTPLGTYGQYPCYAPPTTGQTFLHMYESPQPEKGDGR